MSAWLIIFCFCIVAYGACNVIVFGSGPFKIFEGIRNLTSRISPHFGQMFNCMMCLPANFGWICSLVDLLFIPVAFTPFNIILGALPLTWYYAVLICLCDGAFTSGVVWLIHNVESFFENKSQETTTYIEDTQDIIETEDITLK